MCTLEKDLVPFEPGFGAHTGAPRENGLAVASLYGHGFEFNPILLQHITVEGDMDA